MADWCLKLHSIVDVIKHPVGVWGCATDIAQGFRAVVIGVIGMAFEADLVFASYIGTCNDSGCSSAAIPAFYGKTGGIEAKFVGGINWLHTGNAAQRAGSDVVVGSGITNGNSVFVRAGGIWGGGIGVE